MTDALNPLAALADLPIQEQANRLIQQFGLDASEPQVMVLRLALRLSRASQPAPTLHDLEAASAHITAQLQKLAGQLSIIHQLNAGTSQFYVPLLFTSGQEVRADPMQNLLYAAATAPAADARHLLAATGLGSLSGEEAAAAAAELRALAVVMVRDVSPDHQIH